MSEQFYIVYPDRTMVSAEKIVGWYNDAVFNKEIDGDSIGGIFTPEDVRMAALALEDVGHITLGHAL